MPTGGTALLGDRYALGSVLGRGGLAEVYRGTDTVLRDITADESDRAGFTGVPVAGGHPAVAAVPAAIYAYDNLRMSANTSYLDTMHGEYAHAGLFAIALVLSAVLGVAGLLSPRTRAASVRRAGE